MRRPFDFVHSDKVSPIGSGRAATSRTLPAISLIRDGVSSRRSRIAPSRPELSRSSRFASRMFFSFASIASAIDNSNAFFSVVDNEASLSDAARARSNFSCVEAAVMGVAAIELLPDSLRRKIRSKLAFQPQCDRLGMPPIHDRHVNSALAREFGGTQLRNHAAAAQRTLAVALCFERRSKLANHTLQAWLPAAIRKQESVYIGQQQEPVGFHRTRQQRTQFVIVAEGALQLAHRHAVVLVHDGYNSQREQLCQRVLQITIARGRSEVVARKQQLRNDFLPKEQTLISVHQFALANRGTGLHARNIVWTFLQR